jgi:hypothetical protein
MNVYKLAENITATATFASVELTNTDNRNVNNTGLLHVFQTAPNGTSPTITQLSYRLEGSIDGVHWAPIVATAAITAGGSATTNTVNGGVFKSVALAPFMRLVCTTAPATTSGSTSGGAMLCY